MAHEPDNGQKNHTTLGFRANRSLNRRANRGLDCRAYSCLDRGTDGGFDRRLHGCFNRGTHGGFDRRTYSSASSGLTEGMKLGVLAGVARMALFTADRWLIKDFFCTDMTSSVKVGF